MNHEGIRNKGVLATSLTVAALLWLAMMLAVLIAVAFFPGIALWLPSAMR